MDMRKWYAAAAVGALLAFPLYAQQKDETAKPATEAAAASETPKAAESVAGVTRSIWAIPAAPRTTPFPGPQAATSSDRDTRPPGRLVPRFEINGGYSYINFDPGNPFSNFNNHGGTGGFTYNANRVLGLTGEVGGYNGHRDVNGVRTNASLTSYLFGPRLNLRFDHFVPFAEFLFGGANGGIGVVGGQSQNAFALAAGGGVDVVLTKNVAWRFAQIDYLMTNFSGSNLNANGRQNNLRLGSGLVLRFGIPNPPPPPNHPPVAACSANPTSVYAGSNAAVAVHVNASDPDNDTLTYSYTASGGAVEGTGPDARFNTSGLAEGTYTVNAKVDDGKGGTATCAADITVAKKPNQPPTISCATDHSPIMPGERTGITATASDPDGDPLTYTYTATGGQVTGDGPKATFDSTGLSAGSYTVKCSVSDGRGGTADASTNVDVQQPPPPPQAAKAGDCGYNKAGASRFDNACKRVGDDVALRLTNDPSAKLVIVGYADGKEPKAAKLAQTRADLAKKYIVEKGVDASRITTRTGEASKEKGQEKANRRVDFVIVPEGATY
jgi:outer membrane protein with beta-barrel domain/OmpA family protein/Big-like domain-containing protein